MNQFATPERPFRAVPAPNSGPKNVAAESVRGTDKALIKQTLQDKFKRVYESSASASKKPSRSQSIAAASPSRSQSNAALSPVHPEKAEVRRYSDHSVTRGGAGLEKLQPAEKNRGERTPSNASSIGSKQCSQCSGSPAKGMEYICVHCLNKEMSTEKKQREQWEKSQARVPDPTMQRKMEEAQRKYAEELAAFRKQMSTEMKSALLQSTEKKERQKIESYPF